MKIEEGKTWISSEKSGHDQCKLYISGGFLSGTESDSSQGSMTTYFEFDVPLKTFQFTGT